MERVLQWVASRGFDSRVLVMTASTASSPMLRGAPERGSSSRPPMPCSRNRVRHLRTVLWVMRSCLTMAVLVIPAAPSRMIWERIASALAVLGREVQRCKVTRSWALTTRSCLGRPRCMVSALQSEFGAPLFYHQLLAQDTSQVWIRRSQAFEPAVRTRTDTTYLP